MELLQIVERWEWVELTEAETEIGKNVTYFPKMLTYLNLRGQADRPLPLRSSKNRKVVKKGAIGKNVTYIPPI